MQTAEDFMPKFLKGIFYNGKSKSIKGLFI